MVGRQGKRNNQEESIDRKALERDIIVTASVYAGRRSPDISMACSTRYMWTKE